MLSYVDRKKDSQAISRLKRTSSWQSLEEYVALEPPQFSRPLLLTTPVRLSRCTRAC